jgi:hypothetical protein
MFCKRPIKMSPVCQLQMTLPRGNRGGGVLGVTVRLMSDGELMRLEVLRDLDQRRLTTEAAAQCWGSSGSVMPICGSNEAPRALLLNLRSLAKVSGA